ncbi:hypothetical protein D3C75_535600 [compost metagenome]
MPAILNAVVEPQISTRLRQPRGVPVQEVLRGEGQFRVDREAGGQLITRNEQFFGFCSRDRQRLGNIQAGLAITVAMGKGEDAFAPVNGVLAELAAEQ